MLGLGLVKYAVRESSWIDSVSGVGLKRDNFITNFAQQIGGDTLCFQILVPLLPDLTLGWDGSLADMLFLHYQKLQISYPED